MVSMIKDIEYNITDTHLEARLLECQLIKEIKPRFNAQMKHDQRYIFIKVEDFNRYNPLSIVEERMENCFGPFRSKYTISEFMDRLKNIYPIIKNGNTYEFEYHMFPITMEKDIYNQNKELLLELFTREDNILLFVEVLQARMDDAVSLYRYEMASIYRDMINNFRMLKNGLDGYKSLVSRDILLKLPIEQGYKLFFVSKGSIINSIVTDNPDKEIIDGFIAESTSKISAMKPTSDNEKSWIDFRDILYSEISELPDEMVEFRH
ncbi:MAG: Excinuclease subunit domain protein [Herbinix sp.]|nr:Excinuclease subunit domain protein [Herbinix sp.]